uniref:Uncharacterized protein n=1 Tax=Nelumbo nucifera TaxID=4432 RepID=A0A822Y7G6_NELNU|nr:TPA_asm: hypothetical protein HUJ06_029855 [Nelumbo nucifera]
MKNSHSAEIAQVDSMGLCKELFSSPIHRLWQHMSFASERGILRLLILCAIITSSSVLHKLRKTGVALFKEVGSKEDMWKANRVPGI